MNYFVIEPSVAGELGPGTIIDTTVHPPKVEVLVYSFSGWLGDAIVESFPCFIVTTELREAITASDLTGYTLAEVKISFTETGNDKPIANLPTWKWLKVTGKAKLDDIGLTEDFKLALSEKALEVFKKYPINDGMISRLT